MFVVCWVYSRKALEEEKPWIMVLNKNRGWELPGGEISENEDFDIAALRELYEETGLRGKCKLFIGSGEIISDKSHKLILDFEVLIEGDTRPSPASDASDCKWTPLKDVESLLLADGLKTFLHDNGYL